MSPPRADVAQDDARWQDLVLVILGRFPYVASRKDPLYRAYARQIRRLVYVEPDPSPRQLLRFLSRWVRGLGFLESKPGGVYTFGLVALLPFNRVPFVAKLNTRISLALLRWFLDRSTPGTRVIMTEKPQWAWLKGQLAEDVFVYVIIDDYPAQARPKERDEVAAAEREMLARADMVLAMAQPLVRKARGSNPRTYRSSPGVDYELFHAAAGAAEMPPDLRSFSRPLIGLVGMINDRIDLEILRRVAADDRQRTVVLIGPFYEATAEFLQALERLQAEYPNIVTLGNRPYEQLPAYLQGFDVCIIPYRVDTAAESINPLKVYQYLAVGKPVISTRLPSLAALEPLVTLEDEPQRFARAVAAALRQGCSPGDVDNRWRVARRYAWSRIATNRLKIIAHVLRTRSVATAKPVRSRRPVGDPTTAERQHPAADPLRAVR